MERKIGEIFEYNGEWYQCVEGLYCDDCAFINYNCENRERITLREKLTKQPTTGFCNSEKRNDRKSVIFKKLEKVGEPCTIAGTLYQHYKVFDIDNVCGDGFWWVHNYKAKTLTIEIKQNKEDMEEYEMHDAKEDIPEFDKVVDECLFGKQELKLKPFNFQKAKQGKPVCTRDWRKARIICFDLKNDEYPIVAAVGNDSSETLFSYTTNGEIADGLESDKDLMMLPEKKEGWAVIRKSDIYETEEQAKEVLLNSRVGVMIRKINWEE